MKITITIPDKLTEAFEAEKGSMQSYLSTVVVAEITKKAKEDFEQKATAKAKAEVDVLVDNLAAKINVEVTK